jgi:acyl-coenzyme A synthetase/AMP-(fatty) acid ligase
MTGYPSIDLPQAKNSSYFEKNPIIPNVDMATIFKLLSRKTRNNPAIDCNGLKATYQELIDDYIKVYLALKELGVKKGDIVTISLPSNYQAIVLFWALNELGAVTTYIDTYASEVEVLSYLSKYNSPIFINFDKTREENEAIMKKSGVKNIITLDKKKTDLRNIDTSYKTNMSDEFIDFHTLGSIATYQKNGIHLPNKGNDLSLILYTSGSTGQPKAVELTNKNVLSAQLYAGNTSHTENITGTKTMTCVPLRYPYGMVTSLLTSLLWGKEAIMTPDWDTNTVNYYYGKKPNIIFGSPAVLDLTMKVLNENEDTSQISHFISGGDFLTIAHANIGYEFFERHNNSHIEIGNGCGNAETVSIGSTPVGVPLKQSTAGKILVGSTPMIIDKDLPSDRPLTADEIEEKTYGEVGELCISGAHVFKEYYGEPEVTACAKFVKNGKTFFRTGTLGFIDKDGYFTPTDRKSRFFIRSTGHKVYLDNVQRIIGASNNKIADVAAVKVPNEDELFITKAYVVLKNGVMPDQDTINDIYESLNFPINTDGKLEQLKEYEVPKDIEFIDELPRIAGTEKIDYKALEEKALESLNNKKTLKR